MNILVERRARWLFFAMCVTLICSILAVLFCVSGTEIHNLRVWLFLMLSFVVFTTLLLIWYLREQERLVTGAITQINDFLGGNQRARIDCDEEGALYRLFHEVNEMAAILQSHAEEEAQAKVFMKNTLSDISHQLKTPLATLNIYNGILQSEMNDPATVQEFSVLSEQELERIENLVKNLLTIAKLDAGTLGFVKMEEDMSLMMDDLKRHFSYQAECEDKTLIFRGEKEVKLVCDRVWILEALTNIVKNAFDHTSAGCTIQVEWQQYANIVQIVIQDNGFGIHPEDLPHIFKRFYRSRFSKDAQGVGLGLPLAKAITDAHSGTIEVESVLNEGTCFTINFLIPTKM